MEASRPNADRRIGVIWHTTGSGKSLSMAFLVGVLRRRLANPTFVIEVDRTDLDKQLYDQFVYARSLVGDVKHADSVDELRTLLRTEGGEVIFTTIEKFTGTPISFSGADTVEIFGDLIHTYDIKQSQEDRATVPIYYAPRQVRLHLTHSDVDAALQEITAGQNIADLERRMSRWAALAKAAGAKERVDEIARDLLTHFRERTATLDGKALVVCMTRENCVRLYDALTVLPGCPEVKVVMTGNLGEDPPEWSRAGHITTKPQRDVIKARMVDPDDPLKIAIVCDMWLTGTDIPCLHTLYLDKPMRGHTIIQAISRVNRVFRDKPHGLIVDYIGIADELREATGKYSQGGG